MSGTTAAIVVGGLVVAGGLGYFIWSAHQKAAAAALLAKQTAGASKASTGSSIAHDILTIGPSAIALGSKLADIWA
jgi:hypothetical protein